MDRPILPLPQSSRIVRLVLAGSDGGALDLAADMARTSGAQVVRAGSVHQALGHIRTHGGDLAMVDVRLDIAEFIAALRSERIAIPVLACGIEAPAEDAVAAIRAGARDYVPLPPDPALIAAALLSVASQDKAILGTDPAFCRAVRYAGAMARSDSPMWFHGETGTGKETLARTVHHLSGRDGPFVMVDCDLADPEWLSSELFGHEAGAFPGAIHPRSGRLREAANGTILLREIGALPAALQAALADTLLHRCFHPLGGTSQPVPLSARILTSNRTDLRALTMAGRFRADLMHRIGLIEVRLPPLRHRKGDIGPLARHFADFIALDNGLPAPMVPDGVIEHLQEYCWPTNIRELEEVMHRAVMLSSGPDIATGALVLPDGSPLHQQSSAHQTVEMNHSRTMTPIGALVGQSVAEVERDLILRTLDHCHGNRTNASAILGISVRTMRNKLREFAEAGHPIAPSH